MVIKLMLYYKIYNFTPFQTKLYTLTFFSYMKEKRSTWLSQLKFKAQHLELEIQGDFFPEIKESSQSEHFLKTYLTFY